VKDLQDIPENVKNRLDIQPVKWIDRVFELAFERVPKPLPESDAKAEVAPIAPADQDTPAVIKH